MSTDLLQQSDNIKIVMLKEFGRTPESITADIESIKEWAKKQPHLPEIPSDARIEGFLFLSKFVFAKAKNIIDLYYTYKGLAPEFYKDPEAPEIVQAMNSSYCFPLPKLTSGNCRIIVYKIRLEEYPTSSFDAEGFVAYIMQFIEILLVGDYVTPKILFTDMKNFPTEYTSGFSPILIKKLNNIFEKVYSNRVVGLHLFNVPIVVESFTSLIKSFMKPKIAKRIHIHKSIDTIFEHIPKENLPQDYGGCEKSLETLHGLWKNKIKEYTPMLRTMYQLRTDESKRIGGTLESDILGFEGNFRKLNVD